MWWLRYQPRFQNKGTAWEYELLRVSLTSYRFVNVNVTSFLHSRVGNIEARQVVGRVAEEVQQGVAGLRHHLRNRLVPVTLRNNQPAAVTAQRKTSMY